MSQNKQKHDIYQAGFKLLDKYKDEWRNIHANSISNIARVEKVSRGIDSLERESTRRLKSLDELGECCKSLCNLNKQVYDISNDLLNLEKTVPLIEDMLIDLKNHKENSDNEQINIELEHSLGQQINQLRERSMKKREKLKLDHNKRLEAYEQKQLEELDERRVILEKTFEEEKQRYLERQAMDK